MDIGCYLRVGKIEKSKKGFTDLKVVGYPSAGYRSTIRLDDVVVKRRDGEGVLYGIDGHMLHYTVRTDVGQSGSPILAKKGDEYYSVGIHSHRGER